MNTADNREQFAFYLSVPLVSLTAPASPHMVLPTLPIAQDYVSPLGTSDSAPETTQQGWSLASQPGGVLSRAFGPRQPCPVPVQELGLPLVLSAVLLLAGVVG